MEKLINLTVSCVIRRSTPTGVTCALIGFLGIHCKNCWMENKGKRKKSGASYRKVKKQRVDEEAKLSNFMPAYVSEEKY